MHLSLRKQPIYRRQINRMAPTISIASLDTENSKLTNSNMSADNGRYICYDVLWQIHFCGEFHGRRVRSPVEDNVVHRVSVYKMQSQIQPFRAFR